jgi:MoaA/NifB/PqqE/SkfB family radical SAM enzyme
MRPRAPTGEDVPLTDLVAYVTERCQLGCAYCNVHKGRGRRTLDAAALVAGIDRFLRHPPAAKRITLTGGEPLLAWRALRTAIPAARRLADARGIDLRLALFTNAVALDRERFRFLDDAGVRVVVSIDGPAEVHDARRPFRSGRRSSHAAAWRGVAGIPRRRLAVSSVFLPEESSSVPDRFASFARLGFGTVDLYPDERARWSPARLAELAAAYRELAEVVREAWRRRRAVRLSWIDYFNRGLHRRTGARCSRLVLGPDGLFYPCRALLSLPPARRRAHAVGDVRRGVAPQRRRAFLDRVAGLVEDAMPSDPRHASFCPFPTFLRCAALGEHAAGPLRESRAVSDVFAAFCRELTEELRGDPLFARVHGLAPPSEPGAAGPAAGLRRRPPERLRGGDYSKTSARARAT